MSTWRVGRKVLCLFTGVCVAAMIGGCTLEDTGVEPEEHEESFTIAMKDPGHMHTFNEYTLSFTVTGEDGGEAGLKPVVLRQLSGEDAVRSTKEGDITDAGKGTYTWKRTFTDIGVYLLTFQFAHHSDTFSNCFTVEVSKAGGESIYCPNATSPTYAYQVRWTADPGHVHAGDTATFEVELKRSINTTVNTTQPWRNSFDHLNPADLDSTTSLPIIMVGSASGEDTLTVSYKGQGIYSVEKKFGHVTEETTYWLHVVFTDECGTVDENGKTEEHYQFHVVPGH